MGTLDGSYKCNTTYRSASFIVMKVHFLSQRLPSFARIDKFPTESESEADVVAATPPFPNSDVGGCSSTRPVRCAVDVRIVAGAGLDGAFCACARDRVRHSCAGDGVNEGGFTATCEKIYKYKSTLSFFYQTV